MRIVSRTLPLVSLLPFVAISACFSSKDEGKSSTSSLPQLDGGPPPAAGGSGAFGIVTVNGKQKMYLPQQAQFDVDSGALISVISVIDVGVGGNGALGAPALITDIELPVPDSGLGQVAYATATGGDSSTVVAVSTQFPIVWFIDPNTDSVTGTLTLDATYGKSSFSGGGGYVTGVAVDSAHHRAILSVWNGFAIVDLGTQTITNLIEAPPAENFGFDSVHQRILAPFYECNTSMATSVDGSVVVPSTCNDPKGPDGTTVMTDGLSVIDLTDNTVYTYENPNPPDGGINGFVLDPNNPVGTEPDGASADPTTGVVVIPSEGNSFQSIIDLSKATFDKTRRTVTAPQSIVGTAAVSDLDAVAIEPNSHLAVWEDEFGGSIAVGDLTQLNAGGTAWAYAQLPPLPGGSAFTNLGDPHGLAVTTAMTSGGPVGFVVDSGLKWVARVDVQKLAKSAVGDASVQLPDGGIDGLVTYLDARTKE
jgi:hypothetical protein